ncbi:MAG TPA: hypothetical protein PLV25_08160, partial [Opitutales bacterium]|nr:hypothetical protein [Opitutales bacterium]
MDNGPKIQPRANWHENRSELPQPNTLLKDQKDPGGLKGLFTTIGKGIASVFSATSTPSPIEAPQKNIQARQLSTPTESEGPKVFQKSATPVEQTIPLEIKSTQPPPPGWPPLESLEAIPGSNRVRDTQTNKEYILSAPGPNNNTKASIVRDEAYRAAGIKVPPSALYETDQGSIKLVEFVQTRTLEEALASDPSPQGQAAIQDQIKAAFCASAILGDTQIDSSCFGVDANGQVLLQNKGTALPTNEHPTELWSMRNAAQNPEAHNLFARDAGVTIYDIADQLQQLETNREAFLAA